MTKFTRNPGLNKIWKIFLKRVDKITSKVVVAKEMYSYSKMSLFLGRDRFIFAGVQLGSRRLLLDSLIQGLIKIVSLSRLSRAWVSETSRINFNPRRFWGKWGSDWLSRPERSRSSISGSTSKIFHKENCLILTQIVFL